MKIEEKKNTLNNTNHVSKIVNIFNKLYYDCKHLIFWLFQLLSSVGSDWYTNISLLIIINCWKSWTSEILLYFVFYSPAQKCIRFCQHLVTSISSFYSSSLNSFNPLWFYEAWVATCLMTLTFDHKSKVSLWHR